MVMYLGNPLATIVKKQTKQVYIVRDDIAETFGYVCFNGEEGPFLADEEIERLEQQTTSMHHIRLYDDTWFTYTVFYCCGYDQQLADMHFSTHIALKGYLGAEDPMVESCYIGYQQIQAKAQELLTRK